MRTYLVAIVAPDQNYLTKFLLGSPYGPEAEDDDRAIDSWWIAEDERSDRSDNDSAIFVPRGSQADMVNLIEQHFSAHKEEWDENGYPYAETDVSGAFYTPPIRNISAEQRAAKERALKLFESSIVKPCPECPAQAGELCDTPAVWVHLGRFVEILKK